MTNGPHRVDANGNEHNPSHPTPDPHTGDGGHGGNGGKGGGKSGHGNKNQPAVETFMGSVLKELGAPVNQHTLGFMYAWARREGAGGAYNPLNTTLDMAGATSMNSVGVKNYTSWQQGVKATAQTLANYGDIAGALRSGHISVNDHFSGLLTWSGHSYDSLSGISTDPYTIYAGPAGSNPVGHLDGHSPAGEVNVSGGGGGSSNVPTKQLSAGAISEGLNSMGFASQLVNSNKSLRHAFQEILHKQLNLSSQAGRSRASQILQNTAWWQNHTKSQREFDELKYSDPKTWQKAIHDTRASLVAEAQQMGLKVDNNELDKLSTIVTRNGLTSDEINQHLAHLFNYQPHQGYTGHIGSAIDQIKSLASAYYVPVSNDQIQHLTRQVIGGGMDPQTVQDIFKERALSMFPYLKQQLQNQTVADIVDPYKQLIQNTLEIGANDVKPQDPLIMQALQHKDAQSGDLGLMPLWQFQNKLYDDPRWLQTNNARQTLVGTTGQLLQKMGLIS